MCGHDGENRIAAAHHASLQDSLAAYTRRDGQAEEVAGKIQGHLVELAKVLLNIVAVLAVGPVMVLLNIDAVPVVELVMERESCFAVFGRVTVTVLLSTGGVLVAERVMALWNIVAVLGVELAMAPSISDARLVLAPTKVRNSHHSQKMRDERKREQ